LVCPWYTNAQMTTTGVSRHASRRIPAASPKSSSRVVYETLLERILNRNLTAGTLLQERPLAEALGVSRTPLREALRKLEGEDLILRVNRAVMVRHVTVSDYIEALRVRAVLEGEATVQAAGKIPGATLRVLRARTRTLMASRKPQPVTHWALNDAVHEAIAAAAGNDLMAGIIRSLRLRTRMFNLKRLPDRFLPGCEEHLGILDAIEAGDCDAARARMVDHIENVEKSIIHKLVER